MVWALKRLTWKSELFDPPSGTVLARLTIDSPAVRLWIPAKVHDGRWSDNRLLYDDPLSRSHDKFLGNHLIRDLCFISSYPDCMNVVLCRHGRES
jgi:hypothetical protein